MLIVLEALSVIPLANKHSLFWKVEDLIFFASLSWSDDFFKFDAELFGNEVFQALFTPIWLSWNAFVFGLDWFLNQDHTVLLFVFSFQVEVLSQGVEEVSSLLIIKFF